MEPTLSSFLEGRQQFREVEEAPQVCTAHSCGSLQVKPASLRPELTPSPSLCSLEPDSLSPPVVIPAPLWKFPQRPTWLEGEAEPGPGLLWPMVGGALSASCAWPWRGTPDGLCLHTLLSKPGFEMMGSELPRVIDQL